MKRAALMLYFTLLATGCASVTRGTTEAYAIESDPSGAKASLSTGPSCNTPCSVKVKRRGDFTVVVEKEGYETITATVTSSVDGAGAAGMAGNVLIGGIIGAGIDAGTGAMHSHKPNPLVVKLNRVGAAPPDAASETTDPLDISVGGETDLADDDEAVVDPLSIEKE